MMTIFIPKTGNSAQHIADKTLSEIANTLETDKGTIDKMKLSWGPHWPHHYCWHYTSVYEKYMDQFRNDNVKLLEIGINDSRFPFASPKMWLQYFKNIDLYSVDNFWGRMFYPNDLNPILELGMNFIYADQSSDKHWDFIQQTIGNNVLDFLVEDGSHFPEHMMYSLYRGIDIIKPGGYYFMEDIQNPDKSKGFYGYDNANVLLELKNWSGKYSSEYLTSDQSHAVKNNFDLVEMHLDPNELNYLAVFKKK